MKKNRMMRLASGLLVAVLATTSMISGTYAKYVTTTSATDTARVAKWGVTLAANGLLYSEVYDDVANGNDGNASSTAVTVKTYNKDDVQQSLVAPGTVNPASGFNFTIDGQPEVAVALTGSLNAKTTVLPAAEYIVAASKVVAAGGVAVEEKTATAILNTAYYPVVYLLEKDSDTVIKGTLLDVCKELDGIYSTSANNTITDKAGAVQYSYVDDATTSKDYNVNFDLGGLVKNTAANEGNYKLTWAWAFTNEDNSVDVFDTFLGDLAYAAVGGENGNVVSNSNTVCKTNADGSKFCALDAYALLDDTEKNEFTVDVTVEKLASYGIGITEEFTMSITATQVD